jgi:putative ABC transport system ATP-binding protein
MASESKPMQKMKSDTDGYAIVLSGLRKNYHMGSEQVHALRGVDMRVKKGEYVAIMGPSGSGKSTLLHILGCLDNPSSGRYALDGIDVASMSDDQLALVRSEKIGFVFQAFNLIPGMTAMENVMIPLQIRGQDEASSRKTAMKYLGLVGLTARANHTASELSGGERQRVALARAMANEPSFILADEPTGNLDSKTSVEIMNYIHKLWEEHGVTVVMVTHEPVVARYSQRIIRLKDGIVESEEKNKVFHNHNGIHIDEKSIKLK